MRYARSPVYLDLTRMCWAYPQDFPYTLQKTQGIIFQKDYRLFQLKLSSPKSGGPQGWLILYLNEIAFLFSLSVFSTPPAFQLFQTGAKRAVSFKQHDYGM